MRAGVQVGNYNREAIEQLVTLYNSYCMATSLFAYIYIGMFVRLCTIPPLHMHMDVNHLCIIRTRGPQEIIQFGVLSQWEMYIEHTSIVHTHINTCLVSN